MRPTPTRSKKIARERIAVLFARAREFHPADPLVSDRCVMLARRISMKQRVRIEREFRRQFCRHCDRYLVPGLNLRVRIARGKVTMTCLSCGRQMRIPMGMRHEHRPG